MTDLTVLEAKVSARRDLPPPQVRKALREGAGLSMDDIAEAVGCSRQAVAHWEAGRRYPRAEHLAAYVRVLRLLAGRGEAA